jgi:hypothetical protein
MTKILDNVYMAEKLIKFHPSKSKPTQQALDGFGSLLEPVKAELELISEGSSSEASVTKVDENLWCITVGSKGYWAFLFYTELPGGIIMCLNGYAKKAKKPPELTRNRIRKAKYLIKEVQYV